MKKGFVSIFLLAGLGFALPGFATVNTFYYWHLGESDPGAAAARACTNTIDSVARFTLTNTPTTNESARWFTRSIRLTWRRRLPPTRAAV